MKGKLFLIAAGLCCAGVALAEDKVLSPQDMGGYGWNTPTAKPKSEYAQESGKAASGLPAKRQASASEASSAKSISYGLGQIEKGGGWLKQALGAAGAAKGLADAWKPLSDTDKSIANQMKGGPKVPSKCAEAGASGCTGCFEQAHNDLNTVRFALAKLGAIGKWTVNFTKKSIAFGDSASGVHGVAGIAWQAERSKIEASYASFGTAYDAKYQELIGQLQTALRDVGQCEAKFFKNDDWYDRYGFIYYSFMSDRYRR
jgi:hypothetical protein